MLSAPKTRKQLDAMVRSGVPESLHLDYKDSRHASEKHRSEITKDVSAFANSDGGVIVYGVSEVGGVPTAIDGGVDTARFNQEWFENLILSHINPRLDGVTIKAISLGADRAAFVISIPKSFRGPHQAQDKRYYKRYNFQSVPMEDYEVTDVRNRVSAVPQLISLRPETDSYGTAFIIVSNEAALPAYDVRFTLPKDFKCEGAELPKLLAQGSRFFPPGRLLRFEYGFINELMEVTPERLRFQIKVTYLHPQVGERVSETIELDYSEYHYAVPEQAPISILDRAIRDAARDFVAELRRTNSSIEPLGALTTSSGLNLSVTALRNLQHLLQGSGEIERIHPRGCSLTMFVEVLGVDHNLARRLQHAFRQSDSLAQIAQVEGVTDQLLESIKQYFHVNE